MGKNRIFLKPSDRIPTYHPFSMEITGQSKGGTEKLNAG